MRFDLNGWVNCVDMVTSALQKYQLLPFLIFAAYLLESENDEKWLSFNEWVVATISLQKNLKSNHLNIKEQISQNHDSATSRLERQLLTIFLTMFLTMFLLNDESWCEGLL